MVKRRQSSETRLACSGDAGTVVVHFKRVHMEAREGAEHCTFTMALSISLYASLMSLSIGDSSASDDGMFVRVAVMATSACSTNLRWFELLARPGSWSATIARQGSPAQPGHGNEGAALHRRVVH